ncbi:hypothetical protein CLIB1444_08S01794 [[Candida] jaroonii]|uniref:Uncharacterized protein n=1 Tax=[Candida] jaroonii TaxID=467808 RepID=A0ACA9YBD7_9ASCO|nr:hypothetical protein CLIB1444_08S01794 [[Candida] jaroonii]
MTDNLGNTLIIHQPSTPTFHINELPPEILVEIFGHLELTQLPQIQLVCKYWAGIISNPSIWEHSFNTKFGASEVFPSWSGSSRWVVEYLARSSGLKKWKKAQGEHTNYQILNEFADNITLTNFVGDKLMVYSRIGNSVNICGLRWGKTQTFVPGDNNHVTLADINWNHLVFATRDSLHVKSLAGATVSSSRSSTKEIIQLGGIKRVKVRDICDKFKDKPDIIICTSDKVMIFNLNGETIKVFEIEDIIDFGTDFKHIVVVCNTKILIIKMEDFSIKEIDHEVGAEDVQDINFDFDDDNLIIHHSKDAVVFNYRDETTSTITFPMDVKFGKLQNSRGKRNPLLVGKDGLFYATILIDDTIVIWSVRDSRKIITRFKSEFKYKNLGLGDTNEVCSIELNSGVVIVGGYNGFANVHDLFTGKHLRECSIKFPKKYTHMYQYRIPVREIKVNGNHSNGIIICGDLIQYFQFGEDTNKSLKSTKKKKFIAENSYKNNTKKMIKDQLEDYEINEYHTNQMHEIVDKYNGQGDGEDDIELAIALSKSTLQDTTGEEEEDDELQRALELSKNQESSEDFDELLKETLLASTQNELHNPHEFDEIQTGSSKAEPDEDEELRRVLELSLLEQ